MRRYIHTLLIIASLLVSMPLVAQEHITHEDIKQSVSTYWHDNYTPEQSTTTPLDIEHRNSLRLSYGVPGPFLMVALNMFGAEVDIKPATTLSERLADYRYYETAHRVLTAINLEYSRKVTRVTSLGVKGTIGLNTSSYRHVGTNELLYRNNIILSTLLFNMRFDWLQREVVTLYSTVGVGLLSYNTLNEGYIIPTLDLTYLGLTVGKRLYGMLELGGGMSGMIRVGIGYKF